MPLSKTTVIHPLRIACVAGSLRKESYNRKLLALAVSLLEKEGAETDVIELRDFMLPLYDGDIETERGLPDNEWKLKARIAACQGTIIACPEYNGSVPGTFKNALDWTSRGAEQPWAGKVVGLMGATDGPWGTQRMMPQLRQSLCILNAHVIPEQINVREAAKVWDASGALTDEKLPGRVHKFVREFLRTVQKLRRNDA